MNETGKTINATRNSLEIIDLINSEEGARLSEISRALDISKSAVHAHLNTLREAGYVTKEGEIYHLGLKLFHLGQHARSQNERYQLAKTKAVELADTLNHAVDFDVETNGRIVTLFHEVDESTEIGSKEGAYFYAHTSSTGKAILAELPEERVLEALDRWGLPEKTEHTITEPHELLQELQEVRQRGYAVVDEEWLQGLRAVGVVVNFPDGSPFGAISASGPTYRLTDESVRNEIAPTLVEAAAELEEEIRTVTR